ncbi:hypothetical protein KG088_19090 [Halomonas sp. TRM85114]|uniref:hypothetical protein n=1 Tax=Halomonas jincaotanensis TaxID=2810616 RepID=UPI001BD2A9E0|nr:hypothetical protein [Halomonas jincaotanensis]MBS9405688.1 hypothetical protein [Halomonas jincaotanensis]
MAKSVSLPELPKDVEFEDYVAAYLQAAGFFIEKSVIDRGEAEVLELDIIFTNYVENKPPFEKLIEVKSGGWGFSEIFKMLGWGQYLNIKNLTLVVCQEKPNQEFYVRKANDIGVKLICHPNDEEHISRSDLLEGAHADSVDVSCWRFSYWMERALLKRLKDKKKSLKNRKSYKAMDDYYHDINSSVFFSKNVIKRADKLYTLYKLYPNLSRKVANESVGSDFDYDYEKIPSHIFNNTFYHSKLTDITLSTFIEHRSRIAILKAAVDFTLFKDNNVQERIEEEANYFGINFSLKDLLPETFLTALDSIKNEPYFYRYPVFWQNFMWLFGGFVLNDYKDDEYQLLSKKTGIPVQEIDSALAAYEKLFPFSNGWFKEADGNSNIKQMKMMCLPFMGVGANLRRMNYTEDQKFESLNLTGNYTKSDLVAWNNLAVDVLS